MKLKSNWASQFMLKLIKEVPADKISPSSIVETLIQHSQKITLNSKKWMEDPANSKDKLPHDYLLYPGKMDHTTCLCVKVGLHGKQDSPSVPKTEVSHTENNSDNKGIKMVYDAEKGWCLVEEN